MAGLGLAVRSHVVLALRVLTRFVAWVRVTTTAVGELRPLRDEAELRLQPSASSGVVRHLERGALVVVFRRESSSKDWVIAQDRDGEVGFLPARLVA